jgi:hypothetical protein
MRTETPAPCSHYWIDPTDPPLLRSVVAPIVGARPHQMKPGRSYACLNCGAALYVPTSAITIDEQHATANREPRR